MGWVELAIMLALVFVAYRFSEKWAQSSKIKAIRFRVIRHVLRRVLFPVLLLVVAIIAQVAWEASGLACGVAETFGVGGKLDDGD